MKISNSKKELARIISDNGGWRDGSEFTAQDGDGTGSIDFFKSKPRYDKDDKYWRGEYDYQNRIKHVDVTIKNFHQTILSREEYFHLYPAPDADGWIEWKGGECPVERGTLVDVKYRFGKENIGVTALLSSRDDGFMSGLEYKGFTRSARDWSHDSHEMDIIAYRLHKPEQSIGELCDKVTEENKHDHVDCKPTIEQLAADYRNRKDYADRKQAEADAAKADADAALCKLELAGEAIGLIVTLVTVEKEPELVITDWRDLQIGDIIEYVDGDIEGKIGMTGPVFEFEPNASDGLYVRMRCDNGKNKCQFGWPRKWRFIRRP